MEGHLHKNKAELEIDTIKEFGNMVNMPQERRRAMSPHAQTQHHVA